MFGKKVISVVILCCSLLESVQPTLILLNALRNGAQQTRCKLHQIGSKVLDHEHKHGDPCEAGDEASTVAGQALDLEDPQPGYADANGLQTQQLNGHSYGPSTDTIGQTYHPSEQYSYYIPPNSNQYEPSRSQLYVPPPTPRPFGAFNVIGQPSGNGQGFGYPSASAGNQNVGYDVGNGLGPGYGGSFAQQPGNDQGFGITSGQNVGYVAGNGFGSGYGATGGSFGLNTEQQPENGPTDGYIPGNGYGSFSPSAGQQRGSVQGYIPYEANNGLGSGYGQQPGQGFGSNAGGFSQNVGQQPGQGFGSNAGSFGQNAGYGPPIGNSFSQNDNGRGFGSNQNRGNGVGQGFGTASGYTGQGFGSTTGNFGYNVAPEAGTTPANPNQGIGPKLSSGIGQNVDLTEEVPLNGAGAGGGAIAELAPSASGSIGQKVEPIDIGIYGPDSTANNLSRHEYKEPIIQDSGSALNTDVGATTRPIDIQQGFGLSQTTEKSIINFVSNNDIAKAEPEVISASPVGEVSSTSEGAIEQLEGQANKAFGQRNSQLEIVENGIDGTVSAPSETYPGIDVRLSQEEGTTKKFVPVPSGGGRNLGTVPCKDKGTTATSDGCLETA